MEGEGPGTDDSSFETVSEDYEPSIEPEELVDKDENAKVGDEPADQTTEKGESVTVAEESVEQTEEKDENATGPEGSDEKQVFEKHSEKSTSECSVQSEEVEKFEEDKLDPERIKLIEQIQKALEERKEMKKVNKNLQAKLTVFFKTKKIDLSPYDKEPAELEKEYNTSLNDIAKLEKQLANFESDFKQEVEDYEKILKDREKIVQELTEEFVHLKKSVALRAVDSQSGKRMTPEEVDYYLNQEEKREKLLREIRLEYVKHNNALKEAEEHMERLDSLPHSVNIIEFDQLGVQIQTYFMKIGQREEEITKFQSRCSNTINILSHYKEKLHFVQHEKRVEEEKLKELEKVVKTMRDQLFTLKAKQESTRAESHELQQKFKLLQNESLLDDYLASKQKYHTLTEELQKLKKKHSSIMASIDSSKKLLPKK